jgi:uncharacterized integral membrane protein (TIGR00698 family)
VAHRAVMDGVAMTSDPQRLLQRPTSDGTVPGSRLAVVPGLTLCGVAALLALLVNHLVPGLSPLLVAIVLGMVAANSGRLPDVARAGLGVASKRLLRLGVVLLGAKLVLTDILGLGAGLVAVIVTVVVVGICVTLLLGRLIGVGATQSLLIACGFSICGAAAVGAVDGVVDADETEVATAVGLVVVFGTLMIPFIPLAGRALGLSPTEIGLWAGGSIHEVAQVVAAGGAVGSVALTAAVLVKLGRVLMLGPVLSVIGLVQRHQLSDNPGPGRRPPLVPLFVVGFLAMAGLRTAGLVPPSAMDVAGVGQDVLLAMAMFALGCGVRVAALKMVGLRPFALAAASTAVVATTALLGVALFA